ncbi:MAG: type II toxin-antitoxin system HicB family antitoxin [Aerococcus sp.]|nr:type II toxin-antitoxin system HicB family antitoxin [Aerococcus sp.]
MAKYTFIGVFNKDATTNIYTVTFPDVPGTVTEGNDELDAIDMATDALSGMLLTLEDMNRAIPKASDISSLTKYLQSDNDFLQFITVDTTLERLKEK